MYLGLEVRGGKREGGREGRSRSTAQQHMDMSILLHLTLSKAKFELVARERRQEIHVCLSHEIYFPSMSGINS